jgi:thiosulfate dehydrogenase
VRRAVVLFCYVLTGCGARPAVDVGRALFDDPALSGAATNVFRCANCHEVAPTPTKVLPGYSLRDVASRPTFWGGAVPTLLDATNQCVTQFMRGRPLAPDEERGRALFVYLRSVSPSATAPALPLTIVKDIADIKSGDATRGGELWRQGCSNCHGDPVSGRGRLADTVSLIPTDTLKSFGTDPKTGARPITIEKVRHGKFFAVGGNMPPFSLEALPDAALADILAYLEGFGLPPSP